MTFLDPSGSKLLTTILVHEILIKIELEKQFFNQFENLEPKTPENHFLILRNYLIRHLLSAGVSNFEAGASDNGVEVRLLVDRLARLVNGASEVSEVGGVSSRLPGNDFTGVLEKCSKLARTSVCCRKKKSRKKFKKQF